MERQKYIVGIATTKGDRMTIAKSKLKVEYLFVLLLIMGVPFFLRNWLITFGFKLRKKLFSIGQSKDPSILAWAKNRGIETLTIKTPNAKSFHPFAGKAAGYHH